MKATLLAIMLASPQIAGDIGPKPTMEEFTAIAEPALTDRLVKPDSATFSWPYQLLTGPAGYYTCGLVRSRNTGKSFSEIWVSAVVANGRVVNTQSAESNGMLAWSCKKKVKSGELIPR